MTLRLSRTDLLVGLTLISSLSPLHLTTLLTFLMFCQLIRHVLDFMVSFIVLFLGPEICSSIFPVMFRKKNLGKVCCKHFVEFLNPHPLKMHSRPLFKLMCSSEEKTNINPKLSLKLQNQHPLRYRVLPTPF